MGALSVYLWLNQVASPGDIAVAISLCLRLNGISHWIMWEVSSLFENIGTVQDGVNTLSRPVLVEDKKNAPDLNVSGGGICFKSVGFAYRETDKNDDNQVTVFEQLDLHIKPGEKVGLVGSFGCRQIDSSQPITAFL